MLLGIFHFPRVIFYLARFRTLRFHRALCCLQTCRKVVVGVTDVAVTDVARKKGHLESRIESQPGNVLLPREAEWLGWTVEENFQDAWSSKTRSTRIRLPTIPKSSPFGFQSKEKPKQPTKQKWLAMISQRWRSEEDLRIVARGAEGHPGELLSLSIFFAHCIDVPAKVLVSLMNCMM